MRTITLRWIVLSWQLDVYKRQIQYFGDNLRPYWNREGNETIVSQFQKAEKEYKTQMKNSAAFDKKLMEEATAAGGRKYAELCALAYRQSRNIRIAFLNV